MELKTGWCQPTPTSRKFHYFGEENRSLCGNYMIFDSSRDFLQPDDGRVSPDDCAACQRKLNARKAKQVPAHG